MSNYETLETKTAEFLNKHTDPAIGADFNDQVYSLEEKMRIITLRADDGDEDCERFLNEEVPWDDITVPDPLGWCNKA